VKRNIKINLQLIIIVIIILFALNTYLLQNYTIIAPGGAVDLKDIVTVENGSKENKGSFFLTAISTRPLNLPLLIYAAFDPYVNVQKRESIIPHGWDFREYMEYMQQWMQESQKIAELVALRKAGYNPKINGDGAQVIEIMEESAAKGRLKPGDIIKKVNGIPTNIAEEVINEVTSYKIGDTVELEILRDDQVIRVTVPTIESTSEKGKAIIGVYITTLNWKPELPININIDTGKIGGPSAGSMFVMEILNQLYDEDLTKGHKIAGTGTISIDEKIGKIGGIAQKVIAAHRAGAEIFFAPEENAQDALRAAQGLDIKVVPVKELDDMIEYLKNLK